jgi:molecular chaperone GrpE (heat shock protein)
MTDQSCPTIPKWPFVLGDAALLSVAAWIMFRSGATAGLWPVVICLAAVALGAWLCSIPFLREYEARLRLAEAGLMAASVLKIQNIENVSAQIGSATAQWQSIQEHSARTLQGAREIADQTAVQTKEFQAFFQRANDHEKNTLRLELDKLKRAEADWLQVLVRLLDYVHALHGAGLRSGQERLISELTQFQNACRDAARRVGLIPFAPEINEPFNRQVHQVPDTKAEPDSGSLISEALAPGYTFQAQLLRRALVQVASTSPVAEPAPAPAPETASADIPSEPVEPAAPAPSDLGDANTGSPESTDGSGKLVEGTLF